jgi:hypothetical protein
MTNDSTTQDKAQDPCESWAAATDLSGLQTKYRSTAKTLTDVDACEAV